MESVNDGVPSPQDENSQSSSQLSSSSQIDQPLLTQLPPTKNDDDNYYNTQQSSMMPSESQYSQLMLMATQLTNNDSVLQTQLSSACNDDHDCDDNDDDDVAESQSSQQPLLATQPTNTQRGNDEDDEDDLPMYDESSQPNTQENSSSQQLGRHLSMTQQQQQQSLLLTQQQPFDDNKKLSSAPDGGEQQYDQQSLEQSLDGNDNDDDNKMSQEQRINEEEVEFLYNTQQQNREEEDSDDDNSDDDDMERLVEEQNLAVSLSMEVIEECEESQRSRDNEAQMQSVHDISTNNTAADENDDDCDDEQVDQPSMRNANFNVSSFGFGFASAGSGKAITVNEEDMTKAANMLADKNDTNTTYDDQVEKHSTGKAVVNSAGRGFAASAGSGKAITVNDEEMTKATNMLADNGVATATKMIAYNDEKNDDYDEQVDQHPSIAATINQSSSGFGFASAGSGKAIAVNEEEMTKAAKMLAHNDGKDCDTTAEAAAAAPSKMTPKYQQSQQAKPTTVSNPYARKRSIYQISNGGIGKPPAATTAAIPAALAAPTPSRKLVFNPYAKAVQPTTQTVIRNPYAKVSTAAAAPGPSAVIPPPSRPQLQFSSKVSNNVIIQNVHNVSSVTPKEKTQFRRKGISFSLPIAERLPSRNVSYKPAEILTVGELYQYLYGSNAQDFKELQSVRITGTLLCVSASSTDEKDGSKSDLYSTGTFLLIGDPLEKKHNPTKPLPPKQQPSSLHSGNTNSSVTRTVTKSRPMSILRNKHTPIVRTTQPALTSNADGKPIANPAGATGSTQPVPTTIMKKPILRGGLLNNNKTKKFVYASNKSRSSLGGGLHRKFVTPKRGPTLAAPNTTSRITSSVMRKRPLSMVKSVSVISGRNTIKIESVIQRHPAPLVPVWIGSSLDDDGLDGSVVSDLVMVMGEIVVEHCSRCRERNENGSVEADEEPTDDDDSDRAKSSEGEVEEEAKKDYVPAIEADNQQVAAAVKNVRDAALSIAATASSSAESTSRSANKRPFCSHCLCFLSARIVKNANGTDMNLQKESLRVRREYFNERKKQMECLMQGMDTNQAIFSVGCGPFATCKFT